MELYAWIGGIYRYRGNQMLYRKKTIIARVSWKWKKMKSTGLRIQPRGEIKVKKQKKPSFEIALRTTTATLIRVVSIHCAEPRLQV